MNIKREANGRIISEARKALSLTQKQAGELARLDQSVCSKIERGRFAGSLQRYEQYLEVLGLELVVRPKQHVIPAQEELADLFREDDD